MTENWYLALGLEFDPNPVEDEALIKKAIEDKVRFWQRNVNDFNKGTTYRRYLDAANKGVIEKDMIGTENIRAELIKDAKAKTFGPVDKVLLSLKRDEIPSVVIDKMSNKLKTDRGLIERRVEALGMKVLAPVDVDYKKIYEEYLTAPPKSDAFDIAGRMLEAFSVNDLYEFLAQGITYTGKMAGKLDCEVLVARAEERKKLEFYKSDPISIDGSKLCSLCIKTFGDPSGKANYDAYLRYFRCREILKEAKLIYEITGILLPEQITDYKQRLNDVLADSDIADKVFAAYCKKEEIPLLQ